MGADNAILYATFDAATKPDGGDRQVACDTLGRLIVSPGSSVKLTGTSNQGTLAFPTNVADAVIFAANPNRQGYKIFNNEPPGGATLYVNENAAATTAVGHFVVAIPPQFYYEDPFRCVDAVHGIWSGLGSAVGASCAQYA